MKKIAKPTSRRIFVVLLAIVTLLFLVLQTERFISQGTLLGYQLRNTNRSSGRMYGAAEKSAVCSKIDEKFMSDLLDKEVTSTALFPDKKDLPAFSSCLYNSIASREDTVTILLREFKSADESSKNTEARAKDIDKIAIEGAGEAYVNESRRQYIIQQDEKSLIITFSSDILQKKEEAENIVRSITEKLL